MGFEHSCELIRPLRSQVRLRFVHRRLGDLLRSRVPAAVSWRACEAGRIS